MDGKPPDNLRESLADLMEDDDFATMAREVGSHILLTALAPFLVKRMWNRHFADEPISAWKAFAALRLVSWAGWAAGAGWRSGDRAMTRIDEARLAFEKKKAEKDQPF